MSTSVSCLSLNIPLYCPSVKASLVVEFQRKHFRSPSASLDLLSEGVGTGSKAGDRKSVALRWKGSTLRMAEERRSYFVDCMLFWKLLETFGYFLDTLGIWNQTWGNMTKQHRPRNWKLLQKRMCNGTAEIEVFITSDLDFMVELNKLSPEISRNHV